MKKIIFILALFLYPHIIFAAGIPDELPAGATIPNEYVIEFVNEVSDVRGNAGDLARRFGGQIRHYFTNSIKGFSVVIPSSVDINTLKNDPRIKHIEPNIVFSIIAGNSINSQNINANGSNKPVATPPPPQVLPNGINRTDAELNMNIGSGINVAVIDTGIDSNHPDLQVVAKANFSSERDLNDGNGHGTHVAGTIAALDNQIGVVGVAPGALLWSVKVLNRRGSGTLDSVIAGLDWVTSNSNKIRVANMSLGAPGTSVIFHNSVISAVNAGITIVVAAGNENSDANLYIPSSFSEVIAVSAIADSDGIPGGFGPNTAYGADDTLATFSNWGSAVDIAAPGVNIYSTYKGGGFATMSGTSMASPHVAGSAALYIKTYMNAGIALTPSEVMSGLTGNAFQQHSTNGFTGDRDHSTHPSLLLDEPLLNAGSL